MKFSELEVSSEILKGIEDAGFTDCTQVQEETYKMAFQGKDVCVQSQTGTGKTAAYIVTIFKFFESDAMKHKRALVLVPTRELAVQIEKETILLGKHLPYKVASFYGGVGYQQQEQALSRGVDILIATPGRLIDLFKSDKIRLNDISVLVIDEADRMFDMGFIPDIRYIIKKMPGSKERRTMLFSATLSHKVKGLAWEYMHEPVEIDIMPEQLTVEKITQALYHVGTDEKFRLLLGLLKKYNPQNAIIFTNMKRIAEILSKKLAANGYPNEYIMGDLPQKKRLKVIEGIKNGTIRFVVATDVAARGLHVDDLEIVINYDIPEDCENYVHRIGRTARAGKTGLAISLACEKYVQSLEAIEEYISMKIPVEWADESFLGTDAAPEIGFGGERSRGRRDSRDGGRRDGGRRREGGQSGGRDRSSRDHRDKERKPPHRREDGAPKHLRDTRSEHKPQREKYDHRHPKSTVPHPTGDKLKGHLTYPKPAAKPHDKKHNARYNEKQVVNGKKVKASRDGSLEERVAYYRQKYGEDFKISDEMLKNDRSKKKSIWQKVKGVFSK
jgi:ATP-dependent RNA helicase RhlB